MDKKKIKSLWEIMVPQDTTDPEMRVTPPQERKKIVFTPDPEVKPLANPNPIQTKIANTNTSKTENIKPATASVPINNSNSISGNQAKADGPEIAKPASASEKEETGHRPSSSTSQPNEGRDAGKTKHEEFNTSGKKANMGDDSGETKTSSEKKSNSWQVVAAIILLIIIITATYFINEKIKDNRKKRTEKNDDDFFDSFFDSKTGDIVRFGGITLGLLIAALALLYSTKLLAQAIKSVHESTND